MEYQCIIPPEIVCHVLCFLSPRDVIRMRLVSKQFYELTFDLSIWRTLYTNARLPRPPGPFPSQTAQFLERTLVQSDRLACSWTTQPMGDISSVGTRIHPAGVLSMPPKILYGKWLVGCESSSKFVAYDLDALPHSHQLLWESASPICSWDTSPVVSTKGLLIYIVFRVTADEHATPWRLLEFRVNGDSLSHTLTLDVPVRRSGEPVCLGGGHSPFLYFVGQRLIFDAETRLFFGFPPFNSALVKGLSDSHPSALIPWTTLLTKTHVVALFHHADPMHSPMMSPTVVQAFTAPADPYLVRNGTGVLHLSHEGIIPGRIQRLDLIRNSVIDANSGVTSIRFLHQFFEGLDLRFSCIDLTLSKHTTTPEVLPMAISLHDIAHVNRRWFGLYADRTRYVESSDDGYVRGFWRFFAPHGAAENLRDCPIMRFTIDASRDKCVAVLGRILAPLWRQTIDPPQSRNILFDGVRGRLCYDKRWYTPRGVEDDDGAAVIINIK